MKNLGADPWWPQLDTASPQTSRRPVSPADDRYALLTADLEEDAQNLEAESWSAAVDQDYVRPLHKDAVKRQEVIYGTRHFLLVRARRCVRLTCLCPELIQTEMHHVRTLKVLLHVYLHELRQWQLLEESRLEGVFSGVEALLTLHQHLLHCLKLRQSQSVEEGGAGNNYQISQLGDLLLAQVHKRVCFPTAPLLLVVFSGGGWTLSLKQNKYFNLYSNYFI